MRFIYLVIRFCFIWLIFLIYTIYAWCKSYVLQVIIRFVSFHLLLTWIIVAVNTFGVIYYFVFAAVVHIC